MISPLPIPELACEEYTIDEWYDLTGFERFWWWVAQIIWYLFAWAIVIGSLIFIWYVFRTSTEIDKMEREFLNG